MNENIKSFCLVVITICVFVLTLLSLLNTMDERKEMSSNSASYNSSTEKVAPEPVVPSGPPTSIVFAESSYDFGTINEGDVVHHSFTFKNTGNNPLLISNAYASCGCTVPSYPKEPIPPGGEASIEVQFNSAGKDGEQDKTVTVTANTDPAETILKIHSTVNKK